MYLQNNTFIKWDFISNNSSTIGAVLFEMKQHYQDEKPLINAALSSEWRNNTTIKESLINNWCVVVLLLHHLKGGQAIYKTTDVFYLSIDNYMHHRCIHLSIMKGNIGWKQRISRRFISKQLLSGNEIEMNIIKQLKTKDLKQGHIHTCVDLILPPTSVWCVTKHILTCVCISHTQCECVK